MFTNIFGWLIMVVVAGLLVWLAFRAWRTQNVLVKWIGGILSSLLTLVLVLASAVTVVGLVKAYSPRSAPVPDLQVVGTPEQIARGEHIANAFCASCHSTTNELPLTGGVDLGKDFPMPLGSFVSANLTPAGRLKDWSDGEVFRALRNGVDADDRWLLVMSSAQGRYLSDEDLQAVIAYLRSQPALETETLSPSDQPNLLGIVLLGAGLIPSGGTPITEVIIAPEKDPTVDYGEYIFSYQDCRLCHGENLLGGVEGQLAPIGPSLKVVQGWTLEQYITTLRTGVDPSGHELDAKKMPWRNVGRMDDEELAAMYEYLMTLP